MKCHRLEIHVHGKCPGLGLTFHDVMFYNKPEFVVLRCLFSPDDYKFKRLLKQLYCVVIGLRVSKTPNASCVLFT